MHSTFMFPDDLTWRPDVNIESLIFFNLSKFSEGRPSLLPRLDGFVLRMRGVSFFTG